MKITCKATAGTLESSDAYIELEPVESGVEVTVESVVYNQFAESIKEAAHDVLRTLGVEGAKLHIVDRGALECVIRARVETAVQRGKGEV